MNENAYSTAVEKFESGSNSDILNALVTVTHAYVMTSDVGILDAVIQGVDYIFRAKCGQVFIFYWVCIQTTYVYRSSSE
ncbi:MAG: hypothetical protein KTR16_14915 [Acidiferrobacterales bacterium]|nr:hypothetical protein [Acidiferrobacterales bacterium]